MIIELTHPGGAEDPVEISDRVSTDGSTGVGHLRHPGPLGVGQHICETDPCPLDTLLRRRRTAPDEISDLGHTATHDLAHHEHGAVHGREPHQGRTHLDRTLQPVPSLVHRRHGSNRGDSVRR